MLVIIRVIIDKNRPLFVLSTLKPIIDHIKETGTAIMEISIICHRLGLSTSVKIMLRIKSEIAIVMMVKLKTA